MADLAIENRREDLIEIAGIQIPIIDGSVGPGYEDCEVKIVSRTLKKEDIVMELGAGIGLIACLCARKIGDDRVFCYEANPELESEIRRVFALNKVQPELNMCLLGPGEGHEVFYIMEKFVSSSTLKRSPSARAVTVPMRSVNDEVHRIDPTFLIVDIEGGEYDLFMHMDFHNIRTIALELHEDLIGRTKSKAIHERLCSANFVLDWINSKRLTKYRSVLVFQRANKDSRSLIVRLCEAVGIWLNAKRCH